MDRKDAISLRQYFDVMMQHYCEAHQKEHVLLAENATRAREALEMRLEAMNEFRKQLERERSGFLTQDKYDVKHEALERVVISRIEFAEKRVMELEKMVANMKGRSAAIISALGIGLVILQLILHFVLG